VGEPATQQIRRQRQIPPSVKGGREGSCIGYPQRSHLIPSCPRYNKGIGEPKQDDVRTTALANPTAVNPYLS
jgi:hypothetical protein